MTSQKSHEIVDSKFIETTLSCYRRGVRYLQSAEVEYAADGGAFDSPHGPVVVLGRGHFNSMAPWYIDDTGHFNSIEFNLCYNQLAYVTLGHGMTRDVLPWLSPFLGKHDYQTRKLSDLLITQFTSRFFAQMRSPRFIGEFWIAQATSKRNRLFLETGFAITTPDGRCCSSGDIKAVVMGEALATSA